MPTKDHLSENLSAPGPSRLATYKAVVLDLLPLHSTREKTKVRAHPSDSTSSIHAMIKVSNHLLMSAEVHMMPHLLGCCRWSEEPRPNQDRVQPPTAS